MRMYRNIRTINTKVKINELENKWLVNSEKSLNTEHAAYAAL
jgi:hypothetical protein